MSPVPGSQSPLPSPRQPLNIQQRPSPAKHRNTKRPELPSRSSSFSFSNRTSFSSIDSAFHTSRGSPRKSKPRSNSSGGLNPTTPTNGTGNKEEIQFTCTFCWRLYPSSERHTFNDSPPIGRHGRQKQAPRSACPPCYRAIIDLSIY
ncbi:hypothetical protein B0T20DRAFT_65652 [Sordaria brevicollis]|uniref:Uncharacterized protein n=1 Tax=Sordaria brevicollis TaxID=83679 RepID=A0AAE0P2I0_SORBR|nr:hypothetical protein B0T20DRAFT_65652 [Sordaria brevicollis]